MLMLDRIRQDSSTIAVLWVLAPLPADFLPLLPAFGMGGGTDGLTKGGEYGGLGLGLGFDILGQLLVLPLRSYVSVVWSLNSEITSCAHFALFLHLEYGSLGLFSLCVGGGNLLYIMEELLSLPGIESISWHSFLQPQWLFRVFCAHCLTKATRQVEE